MVTGGASLSPLDRLELEVRHLADGRGEEFTDRLINSMIDTTANQIRHLVGNQKEVSQEIANTSFHYLLSQCVFNKRLAKKVERAVGVDWYDITSSVYWSHQECECRISRLNEKAIYFKEAAENSLQEL